MWFKNLKILLLHHLISYSNTAWKNEINPMKVLSVAEKPSVAKELANIIGHGNARSVIVIVS